MGPSTKKYNTMYKKRVLERDSYLPSRSPKEIIQCSGCGAFYFRRHWTLNPPSGFSNPVHAHPIYCPACRKTRDRYPGGELHLMGIELGDRREIARILHNEEERARQKNPLERIMRLEAKNGDWRVETTTEKLAQRLGRSVRKARGGKLQYKWGHNNKFVRVLWQGRNKERGQAF
jgi:hypothetical protein